MAAPEKLSSKQPLPEPFEGLRIKEDRYFPKTCANCGKVYVNLEEFVNSTIPLPKSSGLMGYFDNQPNPVVALFRNCSCGSTLTLLCLNRRDMSEHGRQMRRLFDQMVEGMVQKGMPVAGAREEIRRFFKGHKTDELDRLIKK
ncbi:MAG: hypothetical protein PHV34_10975 [Verrucomicrobiae bacterium]|nr:hypothetical protein [Verrucomicrobiae bacterium]